MTPSEIRAWIAAGVAVFSMSVAGFGWVYSLVDDVEELKARQEVLAGRMDDERNDLVGRSSGVSTGASRSSVRPFQGRTVRGSDVARESPTRSFSVSSRSVSKSSASFSERALLRIRGPPRNLSKRAWTILFSSRRGLISRPAPDTRR